MSDRFIRVRLPEELFRKYKVYCAIRNVSMTDLTTTIVRQFIREENEKVKIVLKDPVQDSL